MKVCNHLPDMVGFKYMSWPACFGGFFGDETR